MSVDGHPVTLRGHGRELTVDVDSPATAWRLFRSHRPGGDAFQAFTDLLERHDVDVNVHIGGKLVGKAGPSAEPGALSRALGVPVEVEPPAIPRKAVWTALGIAALGGLVLALRQR